jgi:hypothetical protein
MADATDSKSVVRKGVWVRVPPRAPMRWLVTRQLKASTRRLQSAREELRLLDEQVVHLADDAADAEVRAVVDQTSQSAYERRRAEGHVDTINRERARLRQLIVSLEGQQDELLDALNQARS